ncbi:hypothetical protein DICA3_B13124 [Diutina catenulata]
MSQLFYQYFLKKTNLDSYLKVGPEEDPYFEPIPDDERHFYQRKGAHRRRKLPQFIPQHDLKVLESVRKNAYRLDLSLSMCGFRVGWAGVIGLIPWVGDLIALFLSMQNLKRAEKIEGGLPAELRTKMMGNIMFDFGIGLIPIVGDLCNIAYKCNSRNFILLEKYLVQKYSNSLPVSQKPDESFFDKRNGKGTAGAAGNQAATGHGHQATAGSATAGNQAAANVGHPTDSKPPLPTR